MSTEDIEEIATHIIKHQVLECSDCLSPYINSKEKTPFWDGSIYVYNNKDKKNVNFKNKIEVQIKGRKVKYFKENNSYSLEVDYLRGYQREAKGTLFFVVDFINLNTYRVYYCNLLPVDLFQILNNIKGNQKTVSLKLKEIDNKGPLSFRNVCLNFCDNSIKQIGKKIIEESELENCKEINISFLAQSDNYEHYVEKGDVYTYVRLNNNEDAVTVKGIFKTFHNKELLVSINNRHYYNKVTFIGANLEEVIIGPITMKFLENKLIFKIKGSLRDRIKDLKFILDIFKYQYIMIQDLKFDMPFENSEFVSKAIKDYSERLKYFEKVDKVFKFFKTDFDIDFDDLSDKDLLNLDMLLKMFDGNFNSDIKDPGKYIIKINKYNFLILLMKKKIYNYYSQCVLDNVFCFSSINHRISIFSFICLNEVLNISNFDDNIVYKSFVKWPFEEADVDIINSVILTFIKAYDMTKNKKFLNLADKLTRLIAKRFCDDIVIINLKQIKHRKNGLSNIDKRILKEISEKEEHENNYMLKCSIDLLLENNYSFEEHYKLMPANDKKIFKNYPIYNLKKHN